jgi:hypothetical protein
VAAEQEHPGDPDAVGIQDRAGAEHDLGDGLRPGEDVATDVVGVVRGETGGRPGLGADDPVAEAGREPFDLCQRAGDPGRAQVAGEVAVLHALEPLRRDRRAVGHHRGHDVGEAQPELRDAGADPDDDDEQLQRDDHVDERQYGEEDHRRQVLLAAGGQEEGLVP